MSEAKDKFVSDYNEMVRSGYRGRIEVNHGYGSSWSELGLLPPEHVGAIRRELRKYLQENSGYLDHFVEGERIDNNPGVTIVYPKQPLPAESTLERPAKSYLERTQEAILEYCKTPKAELKIGIRLRRKRYACDVSTVQRDLVNQSRLQGIRTGREVRYQSK